MHFRVEQKQLQKHFVVAHRVRQRQFALVRRLIFELLRHAQLVRRERIRVQSGAELVQLSPEDKGMGLELADRVFELE